MRKLLLILVMIAMVAVLFGCTDKKDPEPSTEPSALPGISDDREYRYNVVMSQLAQFVGNGTDPVKLTQEQVSYLLGELADLGDYKDCPQIISRFRVVPNAKTGATVVYTQRNGKQSTETYATYEYEPGGTLVRGYGPENLLLYGVNAPLEYEYDADGRIQTIRCADPVVTLTPSYDDAGNMTGLTAQFADVTYTNAYSYSESGKLLKSTVYSPDGTFWTNSYVYDEQDRLMRWTRTPSGEEDSYISDYTYLHELLYRETTTCVPFDKSKPSYSIRTDHQLNEKGNVDYISRTGELPSYPYAKEEIRYCYENIYFYIP